MIGPPSVHVQIRVKLALFGEESPQSSTASDWALVRRFLGGFPPVRRIVMDAA